MPTVTVFLLMTPVAGILYSAYVQRLRLQEKRLELRGTVSERTAEYAELHQTRGLLACRPEDLESAVQGVRA